MKKVDISYIFYTLKTALGQIDPKQDLCVKHVCRTLKTYHVTFCVYPVVPIKLGKIIKYEAKKNMSIIYLETLNIEWGQIDPKHNKRVKKFSRTKNHPLAPQSTREIDVEKLV